MTSEDTQNPSSRAPQGARVISGTAIAANVIEDVKRAARDLKDRVGTIPGLAVVIVGEDPASQVYVKAKSRKAEECGFHSEQRTLPETISESELLTVIGDLNEDDAIHSILVQLPLPKHIDPFKVIQAISSNKDADGFHLDNVGLLHVGAKSAGLVPCTPAGCMRLIREIHGSDLSGNHAVVIGRSNIVGKPMVALLTEANATVTNVHSRTFDIPRLVAGADIVVAAVGRAGFVRGEWIKPGATVIDVGINRVASATPGERSRIVGDVAFEECAAVASAITPVPGGVGPMTIAMLMANTVSAAHRLSGLEPPIF
ncbi:bifunctional 5,10-methylenetetrahydrofolate dehydrogenase/5,10-methenyltetrahydrofolate cyclohydrolase [Rhizobium leguminosarum]|uniref:bifunctional 5,10-methylenetetrahydrofolate dehydrogenase/5,10-methenyltetrahydrofolate cyclohydrolase n=1 Tax=Rhizobium leguminosarum TaxID=384 RepID=UPI00143F3C29|nr:bifunctional methylenetetrahydrofolate dehydrogenase/methenyltetrahydrofolate cyclohydrolase FolD [Rhizobium leguminosarum]NKL21261.1 bifunctional methylenetetrahydrofolate dehydrogenase/methenyltetrahydrofolate cyclohydrolase FolD [Rhizobium leguminosarum bv. viciae]NKL56768.1 bifunctional methylenetetrahydrofolate dehydrogenase/methenyltetrahydrofolate cyclohydrolase FolD [Rhizobium leguminosarum bv. viciae]